MNWQNICFLLSLIVCVQAGTSAHAFTEAGVGAQSCGTWTADRHDPDSAVTAADESWILGFLTGVAAANHNYDPLAGTDAQGVWAWVDNYCSANPLKEMEDAGDAFVVFHPK